MMHAKRCYINKHHFKFCGHFTHIGTVFVSVISEAEGSHICCNHFQAYYRHLLNCLPSYCVQYDAPFRVSNGVSPLFTSTNQSTAMIG